MWLNKLFPVERKKPFIVDMALSNEMRSNFFEIYEVALEMEEEGLFVERFYTVKSWSNPTNQKLYSFQS